MLKVWSNTTFVGHNPVGTAAVVIAVNAVIAARILNNALIERGLSGGVLPSEMKEFVLYPGNVLVLQDGDY